jgi:mRNA interferase RelE/StbE
MNSNFQIAYADRFLKNFARLDPASQRVVCDTVELLAGNPRHPSLRTKRVQGTRGVYEASANMDLRITWMYQSEGVLLMRNCGHHDRTLRNP